MALLATLVVRAVLPATLHLTALLAALVVAVLAVVTGLAGLARLRLARLSGLSGLTRLAGLSDAGLAALALAGLSRAGLTRLRLRSTGGRWSGQAQGLLVRQDVPSVQDLLYLTPAETQEVADAADDRAEVESFRASREGVVLPCKDRVGRA